MRLYDFPLAPSPRRVRIFLAEKGIEVPRVEVNLRAREQFGEDYKRVCESAVVPMLELDDGTRIMESMAICRYFEALQPEPPLMGTGAVEQALVEMWSRRAEFEGYLAVQEAFRNSNPVFEGRGLPGVADGIAQIPALVERGRMSFGRFMAVLDEQLADRPFLTGECYTVADITAQVTIDFARVIEVSVPAELVQLTRWHRAVSSRASARA